MTTVHRSMPLLLLAALVAGAVFWASSAMAQQPTFQLTLKGNRFEPSTLEVPAGTRIILLITNEDAAAEEFESHDLKLEKIIPAGTKATFRVGPLKPGSYKFMGEFHPDTAQGVLIAK